MVDRVEAEPSHWELPATTVQENHGRERPFPRRLADSRIGGLTNPDLIHRDCLLRNERKRGLAACCQKCGCGTEEHDQQPRYPHAIGRPGLTDHALPNLLHALLASFLVTF